MTKAWWLLKMLLLGGAIIVIGVLIWNFTTTFQARP
jgi:hypothetical protein